MNRARIAALLRELADEFDDDEAVAVPTPPKSAPRRTRRRRLPVVSGNVQVSDVERAAVRAELRRTGFVQVKR